MVSARIGVAGHDADRRQQRLGTRARRPVDGIAGDRRATVGRRRAPGQGDLAVAGVGGQPGRCAGHARWRRGRQRATQEQAAQDGVAAGGPVDRDHDRVTGGHADRGVDPGAVDERVGGQAGGPRTLPVVDRDVLAARAVAVPVERVQVERSAVGGGEVEPEPDLRAVVPGPCPALGPRRGLERPDVAGRGDPAVARGLLDGQRPAGRQADQVGRAGPVGQHVAVRAVVGDPAALDTWCVDGEGLWRWWWSSGRAQEQAAQDGVAAGGPVDRDHDRVTGGHADRGVDPGAVDERVGGQAGGPRTLPVVDRDVLAARAVAVPVERVQVERSAVGGGEVEPEPDLRAVVPGPCPALGPRRGLERPDVAGRGDPAVARGLLDGQRPAGRQADQVGRAGPVGQHVAVRAVVGDPAALDTWGLHRWRRGRRCRLGRGLARAAALADRVARGDLVVVGRPVGERPDRCS